MIYILVAVLLACAAGVVVALHLAAHAIEEDLGPYNHPTRPSTGISRGEW